jgi:uncharacterized membrane protein
MASFISNLIHNRILLYIVFLVAFVDFLYLVSTNDIESASLFGLVCILTAFFSKNMIIILIVAIIITNVLKLGKVRRSKREGLANKGGADEDDADDSKSENGEEPTEAELSVDNSVSKEKFGQDKAVVTTTIEDKELAKSDKMILAQEKMLERMNKYKPLLDTLNSLTKNMAAFKGLAATDKE